jgi:uncharacterized protein (DUF3084 family)
MWWNNPVNATTEAANNAGRKADKAKRSDPVVRAAVARARREGRNSGVRIRDPK